MIFRTLLLTLYTCQILFGQSVWSGNIEFEFSGLENGYFSAQTFPDSLTIPTEGTFASITVDSLGSSNILIPSFRQTNNNDSTYDILLMYMKDSDSVIEPQSWNIDLIDPTNIFDIEATMIFMTEVDTASFLNLIDPILNGEVGTDNWSEYLTDIITQILGDSYLPISGSITISEINDNSFSGQFSGLMGELGWPPQILYIDDGTFNYTNPFSVDIPDVPTNLSVTNIGDDIELSWDYSDSIIITHFNIYHSFNGDLFEYIDFVDFSFRSWTHYGIEVGSHAYFLTSASGLVESEPSEIVEIETGNLILGDVNFDGELNVLDVVLMVSFILGEPTDEYELSAADINQDGVVNILDIVELINIILIN